MVDAETVLARREYFPRGMNQPEGGYRFSLDSLLLSCFASPGRRKVGIDLGCGCGVVGIGMLLRQPGLTITGVEIDTTSCDSAKSNVEHLMLTDSLTIQQGDVATWRPDAVVDFVVSNPPYRELDRGRASRGEGRKTARFEHRGSLQSFVRCAAVALKTRGKFAFVHLPERLSEIMTTLHDNKLEPKRMRLVYGRLDAPPKIVLMEAIKAGSPGLRVEPPLVLHERRGGETRFTEDALNYCEYLRCNA
ncbi:Methyltransferase [Pseudodesulfovibrio profundus]|uniref:Methyltransferase n=1 Tax=Pseudodesulfovibrio profundus TaxID=57320 RepID=A0A2C8FA43_9BACT|nr:methyltransferase [Pseudodesulfovibrio profundus]SOB59014.1 Methyltransferase [Pseudodesulfovibrio profundus]